MLTYTSSTASLIQVVITRKILTGPRGAERNGYLQWDEVNPEAKYIATTDPSISTRALDNLFMKFSIPKGKGGAAK